MSIDEAKAVVIQAIQSGDLTYGDVKQFTDVLFTKLWLENSRLKGETMKPQYQRQQTPHSLTKWILLSFVVVGIFGLVYYSISPNHYWTA